MLIILLRKMLNNKWMFLCLLVGSILVIAMVSSMPIYTNGVLQRMLTRDLENFQTKTDTFPGHYSIHAFYDFLDAKKYDPADIYRMFNSQIVGKKDKEIGLPVLSKVHKVIYGGITAFPEASDVKKIDGQNVQLEALVSFKDHITITNGRMFSTEKKDGVYEAVVTKKALKNQRWLLNNVYLLWGRDKNAPPVKVKIVGVFDKKDPQDPYWFEGFYVYDKSFIIDYNLLAADFISNKSAPLPTDRFSQSVWYYAFDYHKITLDNMNSIIDAYKAQKKWAEKYGFIMQLDMPVMETLEKYPEREKLLRTTLWVLLIPILIMLSFYIFMVSQLIVNHEENEVAVLKSRGANKLQVFQMYFVESLILSGIAFVLGPPLGLLICNVLGSSNGFLEFVQRTALPISLSTEAYYYSLWAMLLFVVSMLIPVIIHSRISIVQHKQSKSRRSKAPLWQKFFLDIVVMGISGYGLYRYHDQQKLLSITGLKGTDLQIDPLLFLISTLFILGAGLFFLRFFPYIVRFIFWLGRRIWSPVFYASFIQVGRSGGQEQFLMLFIILTLSIGIFNANAARTINRNAEEKIKYAIGADVALQEQWKAIPRDISSSSDGGQNGAGAAPTVPAQFTSASSKSMAYIEPPFSRYLKLDGVDKATKVLIKEDNRANYNGAWISDVRIMGIVPNEFGEVAWFRPDLLPYHWYEYLNVMADSPKAVLLSRSFQTKYNVKVGDPIHVKYGDSGYIEATVSAFIDYWPTYNPNLQPDDITSDKDDKKKENNLVVMNLNYLKNRIPIEPYQVWIKKKPDVKDKVIDDAIRDKKMGMSSLKYSDQEIIKVKNDPLLQGTNGVLTLGFVVAMTVSIIGFIIFGILSIRKRVLQFGILRAMGMSAGKVVGMIICEQGLITGSAIIVGIIIGGIASDLFVPLLQIVYSAAEQIPPFKVIASGDDYIRIYMVLGIMLVTGFIVLGRLVSRMRIDQALKLGED